ncbi:hypothetical protein THARTR1_00559 [Trichoderma harzianum]|uniref:Uncharacterized protein n=1 Tax=Trichoderma harzianum TaxID=5544 RepID=A0A2K0URX6_TRIHA|nr:hypothetical protein THARTR1_00559 [Trichoderma harzianum]
MSLLLHEPPTPASRAYFLSYITQGNQEHRPMRNTWELRERLQLEMEAPLPKVLVLPVMLDAAT